MAKGMMNVPKGGYGGTGKANVAHMAKKIPASLQNPTGQTGKGQQPGAMHKAAIAGKHGHDHRGRRWGWLGAAGVPAPTLSSDWVAWAQSCLARVVGPWVPQDGVMGPDTVRAVQQFQTQQQIPVSGMLDSGTIAALQGACSGPAAGPPGPPPPPMGPPPPGPPDAAEELQEFGQAAELLSVTNEQELEQFIGDLISDFAKTARGYAGSPAAQTMAGILKSTARQVLPVLSRVLQGDGSVLDGTGTGRPFFGGDNVFAQELGEMGEGEGEFETAKRYVKFARHAVKRATEADPSLPPAEQAKTAVVEAAKQYAPGLTEAAQAIVTGGEPAVQPQPHHRRSGEWVRKGKNIVLQGFGGAG
jgi:peptidoglycan hydrolase-like protein with peptidoglycan-binding domain